MWFVSVARRCNSHRDKQPSPRSTSHAAALPIIRRTSSCGRSRRHPQARHDVTVKLPPPEDIALTIAGPITRWLPSASGIDLLPFPNCINSFALEIASGKPDERQVDVDVFPILSLPAAGIPPGAAVRGG